MDTIINAFDVIVSESQAFVEFTLSLSAPSTVAVAVDWDLDMDSAGYGDIDSYAGGTAVFQPGVTTQTLRLPIDDDRNVEALESFQLALANPVNAQIANDRVTATVVDNDRVADSINPANLSVSDVVLDEQDGSALFYVTLNRATTAPFSVDYATQDRSTTAGSDYIAASGTLGFAPGETVQAVRVSLSDDALAEPDELFELVLSNLRGSGATQVQLADAVGTGMIGHNDIDAVSTPVITAQPVMVGEADGYVDFAIQLSAPSTSAVSVDWWTTSESAGSGDFDYLSSYDVATLVFAPGVTTQTVRVALGDDSSVESLENFALKLGNATNATLGTTSVNATIVDNDSVADNITPANLRVHDVVVDESQHTATFYLELDRAVTSAFNIDYTTRNLSAEAGSDYTAHSGTLGFAAGDTLQAVTVQVADDTLAEGVEQFQLVLSNATGDGASQVAPLKNEVTAVIGTNDSEPITTPTLRATSVIAGERDGYLEFVLSLDTPSTNTVSVDWDLDMDSAGYGDIDSYAGGTAVFQPGVTTQTLRLPIDDDRNVEALESFQLALANPVNAQIANDRVTATVVDNDRVADSINPANLSVSDVVLDEQDGSALFYVTLNRATTAPFSVDYATQDRSTTAGSDYIAASGTLGFAPGETVQAVRVSLSDDALAEPDELFELVLSNLRGSGATQVQLADAVGTGMIGHNDIDAVSTPVITAQPVMVGEADGYVDFAIQLSAPSTSAVSVDWWTTSESAGSGDFDYLSSYDVATLVFAPGVTTQTVRVALGDDSSVESLENFALKLGNATNATLGTTSVNATIVDNDSVADNITPANLRVHDVVVDESQHTATFYLELDRAVTSAFNIDYTTRNLSAEAGSDYTAHSGTLGFAAGDTLQAVTVQVADDTLAEGVEQFQLVLSNPAGSQVKLVDAEAIATLEDGVGREYPADNGTPEPDLNVSTVSMKTPTVERSEGDTGTSVFKFTIERTGDLSQPADVGWAVAVSDVDLASADDFVGGDYPSGVVSFSANQSQQIISVEVQGDVAEEVDERFVLNLSTLSEGTIIGVSSATATILDDDTGRAAPDAPVDPGPDDDTFIVQQGVVSRANGDDNYILSEFTTFPHAKVTIVDSIGSNQLSLYEGLTVRSSAVTADALQLTLGNGSEVTVLNASSYQYSVTPSPLTRTAVSGPVGFDQFISEVLGIAGGAPTSGIAEGAEVVLGTGGHWSSDSAPVREAADDIFIAQRGITSRGDGDDIYVIADDLIAGQSSVTISDPTGDDTIALVDGLQISSFAVANDALKLSLINGQEVTILSAGGYQFMIGGDLFSGISGATYSYADFVQNVLGVSGGVPSAGTIEGGSVIIGTAATLVELPIAAKQTVQASAATEIFTLDVTAAQRTEVDTQLVLSGFDTSNDTLQINWGGEWGSYSLSEIANMASINAEYDPFADAQVITFGMDANSDPISLTLQGVSDPSLVSVTLA
jgi:hypothetical protein